MISPMVDNFLRAARKILPIAILLLTAGCSDQQQSFHLSDLSAPASFTLRATETNIYSLSISGSGFIEGKGSITLYLNGQPYKSESLWGDISFHWNGDWYADHAELMYQPAVASYGHLTLNYDFAGTSLKATPTFPAEKTDESLKMKTPTEFASPEWHRKKWQESPAIINISNDEIRLLFNRPEKLFQLRRAQFFRPEEAYEYSDDVMTVVYRIDRLEPPAAHISYEYKSSDGELATGSFKIEARGE